jgi:hypothetical protein
MATGGDDGPSVTASQQTTFELGRFTWEAPDRLEVVGTFIGLSDRALAEPALVVHGSGRTHRLPAVPASLSGSPMDRQQWSGTFAWQEAPAPFDAAELAFGGELVVELPEPRRKRRWGFSCQVLEVQQQEGGTGEAWERPDGEQAVASAAGAQSPAVDGRIDPVRLQAEVVAAQAALHEVEAARDRAEEEAARARQDLAAERERHSEDAGRFRDGLATVQQRAEEAVAAEHEAVQQLVAELFRAREAVAQRDDALHEVQTALETAASASTAAEAQAREEVDGLRRHVARLQEEAEDAGRLRGELDAARRELDEARAVTDRLVGRLTTIREALEDGG